MYVKILPSFSFLKKKNNSNRYETILRKAYKNGFFLQAKQLKKLPASAAHYSKMLL